MKTADHQWPDAILEQLCESIHLRKTASWGEIDVGTIKERLQTLLDQDLGNAKKEAKTLQKSLQDPFQALIALAKNVSSQ